MEETPRPPNGDWLGTPYLRFEREGPFATVTVDRPEARNALTPAMYFGLRYAVRHCEADPDIHGLLLTGVDDVFIPGGDLGRTGIDTWMDFSHLGMETTPFDTLRTSSIPVVAAVNGICQGGGFMITLCSDVSVVSERATFRVPELFRGISDTYYAQVLARTIGPVRTRDLMFTGRVLTASEALDWGLVTRVVPHEDVMDEAKELLAQCCRTAPLARADIKKSLDDYIGLYDRTSMRQSQDREEAREGFAAFKERRSPEWVVSELRTSGRL
ncbi:UNVERIFIED_ORG: enoyl-CoA hydratase/carnithine racemase [Nocardia globerula]|uniref:Enoyl-CoA hydratase/carnithine racemase n=1 Tax=Nocardia globerula TaxID=1818 RepID=A0A652YSM3_NOCGL|nr:enoyl-CoA hydratase/isomerase family protein [Rhodococcus globerulus]NMD61348.1 enoyl-CoA hydratase/isomerase family protein [Nocardia globerula]PVX67100.1 enoyl-CoA hydratase/carnithine racemase [Rhodococcus globerulus]